MSTLPTGKDSPFMFMTPSNDPATMICNWLVFTEIFQRGQNRWNLLYLIEKYKGLARSDVLVCISSKADGKSFCICVTLKKLSNAFVFVTVDVNHILKFVVAKLFDDIGLANLSCSIHDEWLPVTG